MRWIGLILPGYARPDSKAYERPGPLPAAALWGGLLATNLCRDAVPVGPDDRRAVRRIWARPLLLLALGVMALDYLLMALAHTILAADSWAATSAHHGQRRSRRQRYMADIRNRMKRLANFGLIGARLCVGFDDRPMLGGALAGSGRTARRSMRRLCWRRSTSVLVVLILPENVDRTASAALYHCPPNPLARCATIAARAGLRHILTVSFIILPWRPFSTRPSGLLRPRPALLGAGMMGLSAGFFGIASPSSRLA